MEDKEHEDEEDSEDEDNEDGEDANEDEEDDEEELPQDEEQPNEMQKQRRPPKNIIKSIMGHKRNYYYLKTVNTMAEVDNIRFEVCQNIFK
jgi:cobalamin biosynthesis protein CobT